MHRYIYNNIYIENIVNFVDKIEIKYDFVFLGDVLEHIERQEGLDLIEKLKKKASNIIIITPIRVSQQDDIFGNKYEKHVSEYNITDFEDMDVHYFGNSQYIFYSEKKL